MEDILIILIGILVILMLVIIALYNGMDRRRYRMDCLLRRARPALDDWADACDALLPGSADEYRHARKNWEKTACLQQMVESVRENSIEKLELQEMMLDFSYQLRQLAEPYNEKLESPLFGEFYRLLGFRYYTPLDFYPDIRIGRDS